MKLARAHSDVN